MNNDQPKGIAFFNIKTGYTHYAQMEAQIQAYINSSDMGINASRDQDFGWRLAPEWVKAVRAFRNDESKMDTLSAKLRLEDGISPTTVQILHDIYGRQVRAWLQRSKEEGAPFEGEYLSEISNRSEPTSELPIKPGSTEDAFDSDLPEDEAKEPTPTPAEVPSEPVPVEPSTPSKKPKTTKVNKKLH